MLLSELVAQYLAVLPAGMVLDDAQLTRNLRKAVRLYCGYATLINSPSERELASAAIVAQGLPAPLFPEGDVHSPVDADDAITGAQDFDLTASECAIIRPIWYLYNEWENATSLEASRAMGLDVYGRTTGEIAMDMKEREMEMANLCFVESVVSI